jgi:Na+/H+ antiporter NhaD/arsenite permease-like protein
MLSTHRPVLASLFILFATLALPTMASTTTAEEIMDFTGHWAGFLAIALFIGAYSLVILEEAIHLRKSKPVIVAAGFIWLIVALLYAHHGDTHSAEAMVQHNLLEFAELFLFLLAAMTYINTLEERGVFDALRVWLVSRGLSLRAVYWVTGTMAFFISPVADNLTTALLMAAVIMAVGSSNHKFVTVACINVVIAANAGGAFSPFGDITTLMVWQKGIVQFHEFFKLFIPSVINWVVPAALMSLAVPKLQPDPVTEKAQMQHGAFTVAGLFVVTIIMAVSAHNFLHLPPVLGMMTGLGFLKLYSYYLQRCDHAAMKLADNRDFVSLTVQGEDSNVVQQGQSLRAFNVFRSLERAEWDTLMFFYGIILCVGGLGALGYLEVGSRLMYEGMGPDATNILVGLFSAVIDNIPVMFAVLSMHPDMSHGHWLLVTLTAGVGGSLLSIGSAAGVAVMGQARGVYTFMSHLKWSWAIALGYAISVWAHYTLNSASFQLPGH